MDMEYLRDVVEKLDYTHGITFALGAFLMFGALGIDANLSTTTYTKPSVPAAAIVSQTPPPVIVEEATTTEDIAEEENEQEEVVEEEVIEEEEEELVAAIEEAPEVFEPEPEPEPVVEESNEDAAASVQAALQQAQETLAQLQSQQEEEEDEAVTCFTAPNGKKIDAAGNELNDDCTPKSSSATASAPQTTTSVDANGQTVETRVADGYWQLPTGKWTDANGNLYDDPPMITQVTSNTQQDNYFTTPGGVVLDRNGNVISRPEEPEEEIEYIPVTQIDPNNLPESGSTITIPKYIESRSFINPHLTCTQLQFGGNDRELCELFKSNRDDYEWELVDTP